jgi:threonine aldolase
MAMTRPSTACRNTADLFGFEDAVFAPSGTQSNLLALLAHCGRGDEYLVGQEAHTYRYEGGGAAVLGSIQPQPIINQADGSIALADIESYIKPDDFHFARTRCWRWKTPSTAACCRWITCSRRPRWRMAAAWPRTSMARASAMLPSSWA